MSPRVLFFLGLAMLAVAMVNASCPCGRGVDACTCDPFVVRPPKIHRPVPCPRVICAKINPPKYESSDPCCCKHNYVGVPPRPAPRCPSCYKEPEHPAPCNNGPVHTIPFTSSDFVAETHDYDDAPPKPTGVSCPGKNMVNAADAVSLHLAYAAGLNRPLNVKEGMLSYGFHKTPEYQPIKKEIMNIPEEKIAVVDKKILELRLPSAAVFDHEEETLPEPEDDFYAGDSSAAAALSYADLGYQPEKGKPCAWKPAPPCHHPHSHSGPVVIVSDHSGYSDGGYGSGDSGIVRVESHEDSSSYGCGGYRKCAGTCGRTCKACSY